MGNVLDREKQHQIIALGRLGWSLRQIEDATGVRRETASRYLKAAGVAVRRPGRWGHPDAKAAIEVFTEAGAPSPPPRPGRSPSASACEPYRELVEAGVGQGRDARAIWQDLVDDHGFTHSYQSVRRFVVTLRGAPSREAHPVIVTAPGAEGQVDYGDGPMVRQPETGKYRRTRLFVFTLGCSRKSVRLLTFRSSTQIWVALHERAFRRLGGTPCVVVLDNLKEGVLTPDVYEPALNPVYRDMLAHYGVTALPCRVRDPNRKGKVESGVQHAQRKLRGLRFEGLDEAQTYLDRWETTWADTRIHGTTKRQVAAMFAEEQPHLQPLPAEPFRIYQFGTRTVHLDGAVEVAGAYYHVPPGHIGRRLAVQWDVLHVRILEPTTGRLLREHLRQQKGHHRLREEDRPAKTPVSTVRLLARATTAGAAIGRVCQAIHGKEGEVGVRRILGMLSLVKTHGRAPIERACEVALEMAVPTYRFVRRYVERQQAELPLTLTQVDPLIRRLTAYRDLIDRRTEGDPT